MASPLFAKAANYEIFVGISNYADPYYNAPYLDSEARLIRDFFNPAPNESFLITNERATKRNILNALKVQAAKATQSDMLFFFYSGRTDNESISAYDKINSISYSEIAEIFKASLAGLKIFIVNNCNTDISSNKWHNFAEDKFLNEPVFMLQSACPDEKVVGNTALNCTYFCHYLLEAISGKADLNRDRRLSNFEIYTYVSIKVKESTNDKQHPIMVGGDGRDEILFTY